MARSIYVANDADGYEQSMGRWSRRLATLFIDFAAPRNAGRILDVSAAEPEV